MNRSRVCLDCRTVVADLPTCPGGPRHRVVDLSSETGREYLVAEVWGPPSWRRERRRLARAGGGGAAAGGLGEALGSCGGCDGLSIGGELGEVLGAILVVLAVALAAMLIVWLLYKLAAYIAAKRNELKPNGALLLPVRHRSSRKTRGVVLEAPRLMTNPVTGDPCVGWALELTTSHWFAKSVMLRDGQSFGFDVKLEDGRIARVPAGMLRLQRGGSEESPNFLDGYLATIDPAYDASSIEPAIPHDAAGVVSVRAGDEVELVGDLHLAPDPDAAPTYRGAAAMVLVPNEPIAIRRV